MRNSLRWKIFGNIVLAVLIIYLVNRVIAQVLTPAAVIGSVKAQIARSMEYCQSSISSRDSFLGCAIQNTDDVIFGGLSKHYNLCPAESGVSFEKLAICDQIRGMLSNQAGEINSASVEVVNQTVDEQEWYVAKYKSNPQGIMILIRKDDIDNYLYSLWTLRAKVIIFTSPFIIFCLLILT